VQGVVVGQPYRLAGDGAGGVIDGLGGVVGPALLDGRVVGVGRVLGAQADEAGDGLCPRGIEFLTRLPGGEVGLGL